ncbi:outer membrane beta-barrel protein [Pontibacter virosus]|uniref:Outer membrane protein with beta-barrel domain n=1 Tax=Pontibacter virosus TaxID=1765052 RepID=A0A2U1APC3_9BACT|nr:outer membrane beta-barrel protein [Pontibacter virosus]PVY38181.1 outer membrane protein with beta-barrel domain [Pontibacter virosus]
MKTNIILLWSFLLAPFSAIASEGDTAKVSYDKLYGGISFSTVSHHIYYKDSKAQDIISSGYFAPLSLYLGYNFGRNMRVQAGLAYGGSSEKYTLTPDNKVFHTASSRTHVIAMPVTLQHVMFKFFRRFPMYATGTLMPAYGISKTEYSQSENGVTAEVNKITEKGINTFVTAGIGLNYKISPRLYGQVEYHALKHNLTGGNSFFHDWDQGFTGFLHFYKSVGIGLNYKLGLED